jgi:uncharacterized RDD family membrane protein YckC
MSYYLNNGGAPIGPFSVADLIEKLGRNEISYETLCWEQGASTWKPISSVVPDPTTPQGNPLEARRYKTVWRRVVSSCIDYLPYAPISLLPIFVHNDQPGFAVPVALCFAFGYYWLMFIIAPQAMVGKTPGMWAMRLKVNTLAGENISDAQAIGRSSLAVLTSALSLIGVYLITTSLPKGALSAMSFSDRLELLSKDNLASTLSMFVVYVQYVAFSSVIFDKKRRCLYDIFLGTVVERDFGPRQPFWETFRPVWGKK